jgi:hypothetical protein
MSRALGTIVLVCGVTAIVGFAGLAQADVIVQHVGALDPTGEGFTLKDPTSTFLKAADHYLGEDSWWTANSGGPDNDPARGYYQHDFITADLDSMSSSGWRGDVRIVNNRVSDDGTDYGVGFSVDTATRRYEFYLGTDASSNPLLYQYGSSGMQQIATVTGSGYHTYSFVVPSGSGATADFRVDDISVGTVTGVEGTYSTPRLWFGSAANTAHFSVNYALASVSTIPEPSSLALLSISVLSFLAYAWRRRK